MENIIYQQGFLADKERQALDLYLPNGAKGFPTLIFVHPGGWSGCSKEQFKIVGETFIQEGIGVAVINYRLSPKVKHPCHIQDVAAAFNWIYRNIETYGGDKTRIVPFGYSAGGHLVALLALNDKYISAHGLKKELIPGVICVSGVYNILAPMSMGEHFKIPAFGDNPIIWDDASPIQFITNRCCPFILVYGEKDEEVTKTQTLRFYEKLITLKCEAELYEMKERDHFQLFNTIGKSDDLLYQIVLQFIEKISNNTT